jgi:uncharacterized membrane protein
MAYRISPDLLSLASTQSTRFSISVSNTKGIPMSELKQIGFSDKAAGAIAYITVLPAIAFLILVPYKKSLFVRFHAWQSIFLNFVALILSYLLTLFVGGGGITALKVVLQGSLLIVYFWIIVWVFLALAAFRGRSLKLPIIGKLAERQANG